MLFTPSLYLQRGLLGREYDQAKIAPYLSGTGDSQRDSRESFAIDTPMFIARRADSPESLEIPIRANHAIRHRTTEVIPRHPWKSKSCCARKRYAQRRFVKQSMSTRGSSSPPTCMLPSSHQGCSSWDSPTPDRARIPISWKRGFLGPN